MEKRIQITIIVLTVIVLSFVFLLIKDCSSAIENIFSGTKKFSTEKVATEFKSYRTEVVQETGSKLVVGEIKEMELFSRTSEKYILWETIYLGKTSSEIRVPVSFKYFIDITDEWNIKIEDKVCYVISPVIQPLQPPSIYTDQIEKRSDEGWARFNAEKQMLELEKSITPELEKRAGDSSHLNLVKDSARRSIENFVRIFLLRLYTDEENIPVEFKIDFTQSINNSEIRRDVNWKNQN